MFTARSSSRLNIYCSKDKLFFGLTQTGTAFSAQGRLLSPERRIYRYFVGDIGSFFLAEKSIFAIKNVYLQEIFDGHIKLLRRALFFMRREYTLLVQ